MTKLPLRIRKSPASVLTRGLATAVAGALLSIAPSTFAQSDGHAAIVADNGGRVHAYDIHVLHDDASFAQPVNQWTYFFKVAPGIQLTGAAYLDLEFDCSPTIRPGEGTISILLNNKPVASRKIGGEKNQHESWRVSLPLRLFLEGFNDLRVISRQVGVDGPCKDVDFSANWVRLNKSSNLHIERVEPNVFPLYAFPFPYLDTLNDNPIQAAWVVPSNPKPSMVGEAFGMASDWGRYEPSRGLPISLIQGQPHSGQNIIIGSTTAWNSSQAQSLGPDQGALGVSAGPNPGSGRLSIFGPTEIGLQNARKALGFQDLVGQMRGTSSTITAPPAVEAAKASTRVGKFTFTDLNLPFIRLAGSYRQVTTLTIQRPVRCDLGRDSFLVLHFRHSANLNPLRSSLNLKINGVPFSSTRLDGDNANDGVVKARIPLVEMTKNLWQIEIMSYHDLASIDCSKSYDDVAYTVIEGDSTFELGTGVLGGSPFLDAFPYLIGRDGKAPTKCAISLPANPSDAVLSLGASLAARAAQMNRTSFDWDVNFGGLPESKNSSIYIGTFSDAARLGPIAKNLLVAPSGDGSFTIDPRIRLLKSSLNGGVVIQAVRSPWTDAGVLYVILGASDSALETFTKKYLSDPTNAGKLNGEVSVMTSDGQLISLATITDLESRKSQTEEMNSYTPTMIVIGIAMILFLLGMAYYVAKQFTKKTPPSA